jgi:hypothetical protein
MSKPFEIQYEATEESKRLFNEILNGEEMDAYRLQLGTYVRSGKPLGKSHIIIKRKPHNVWIDVYVSEKLRTIYPLMFHFNRKGEPTDAYRQDLEEYIGQIKAEEA